MGEAKSEKSVLSTKLTGGPQGLGEPDEKFLRKVEIEVMIPKLMREKAKVEKCPEEVKAFEACCKESSIFMVVTCRKENTALKNCLTHWYQDEGFKNICKEEYLRQRSEYRTTGIKKTKEERH